MAQLPMTLSEAEGYSAHLNLCHTHNSGNIACLESALGLWFKLFCQSWRTSQRNSQSCAL